MCWWISLICWWCVILLATVASHMSLCAVSIVPACSHKHWWQPGTGNLFALNQACVEVEVCHFKWLWLSVLLLHWVSACKMIGLAGVTPRYINEGIPVLLVLPYDSFLGPQKGFGGKFLAFKVAVNHNGLHAIFGFEKYLSCMAVILVNRWGKIKQTGTWGEDVNLGGMKPRFSLCSRKFFSIWIKDFESNAEQEGYLSL